VGAERAEASAHIAPAVRSTAVRSTAAVRSSPAGRSTAAPTRVSGTARNRAAITATAASVGLISSLLLAMPARADDAAAATNVAGASTSSIDVRGVQKLSVSATVAEQPVLRDSYAVSNLANLIASQDGLDPQTASAIAGGLSVGQRLTVVQTALHYLGDPYVLGGADESGIDCSGLTLQAYASVGIPLVHLVSAQDAVGTPVSEADAQPGDLVVFDDHEHIAVYLGAGLLVHAPEEGRPVEIEPVAAWAGIAHHFTRILP
jgi:cell wall-associated NlpC family hydrolase